jgi:SAM-dependent methyltransferase
VTSAIEHVGEFWERHARRDPLWAILSDPTKKGRKWDLQRFFETGAREISLAMYELAHLDVANTPTNALDFGCGVGRLTQALAGYFDRAVGVDISPTMIRLAERLNRHPDQVRYVCNSADDLSIFGENVFDFVYTDIVLQHLEPAITLRYLTELFRILSNGGVLIFQLPSHPRPEDDLNRPTKAMPEDAYRARVAVDATPHNAIGPSSEITLLGSVTNISPCVWSQPEYGSIRLGNHWLDRRGETMLIQDDGRTYLPGTLGPGDTFSFALSVRAPAREDEYQCEIDVVHEGISWFGDKGSDSARFTVRVRQRPDEDESVADESGGVLVNISKGHVQGSGRHALVGPRLPDIYDDLPAATEDPGDFPMHGIHREAILKLISAHGAQLLHIEEDGRCGKEWVGYRYFVRK